MLTFIARRLLHMIPTLFVISIISFILIQLPKGDFFDSLQAELMANDNEASKESLEQQRIKYHLDKPLYQQYLYWVGGFFKGDFGLSLEWQRPVNELIYERLGLTFALAFGSLLFIYVVSIPIGVYSARRPNTVGDHVFTSIGVFGLCIPDFILAIVAMYVVVFWFGGDAGGMFSREQEFAPWTLTKVWDLIKHLPLPVFVVGVGGTAALIRIMRNSMLNCLKEQYITTARAKGLSEGKVVYKYGLRVAINPLISMLGMQFPTLISGSTIVAIVLSLPTMGPMYLRALQTQDMFLAGTFLLFLSTMLLLGNLIADILLALADPRIRLE
ncbi:ABC transporter permease [Candidatus Sumerlaeota bacterium]|nr:ABC transporter permease [Candidatus Sumerlaeota bacterium]